MFALFYRHRVRTKTALPDFAGAAQFIIRWLSLPKRRAGEQSLQLLESVPLSAQASVALIRFEKERFVLGVTTQNVTVLTRSVAPAGSEETQAGSNNPIP